MDIILKEVLKKINDEGYESYAVGGYPRDLLLGINNSDYDICTNAKKEILEKIFNVSLINNFGSMILNYKNRIFEITTYRKEINYTGIRTPNIVYTDSLKEDLERRDFTINAICLDYKENVIDLLNGQEDLKNKIIRCIGEEDKKLSEDPLRILRAIRFATILNFKLDEKLKNSIIKNSNLLKNLSYFRKKQELDRIFNTGNIELLKEYNLLDYLELDIKDIVPVNSSIGMWAQISYSSNYQFTKKEKNKIDIIKRIIDKREINSYDLYTYDLEVLLICSKILGIQDIEERYEKLPIKVRDDIDITYRDIVSNTKRNINDIYRILEQKILDGSLKNDYDSIVNYINYDIDK